MVKNFKNGKAHGDQVKVLVDTVQKTWIFKHLCKKKKYQYFDACVLPKFGKTRLIPVPSDKKLAWWRATKTSGKQIFGIGSQRGNKKNVLENVE